MFHAYPKAEAVLEQVEVWQKTGHAEAQTAGDQQSWVDAGFAWITAREMIHSRPVTREQDYREI